jgi:hypothetical protein
MIIGRIIAWRWMKQKKGTKNRTGLLINGFIFPFTDEEAQFVACYQRKRGE